LRNFFDIEGDAWQHVKNEGREMVEDLFEDSPVCFGFVIVFLRPLTLTSLVTNHKSPHSTKLFPLEVKSATIADKSKSTSHQQVVSISFRASLFIILSH
jgi:hypothetical protein